ncbi:sn-glycerol-3-phosphate ABC transporter substrate-binding protein UgpB [Methylobacterium sp. NEAU 140]|uniref:sn-glycerol-3-phosphate ABC transporter substrate-binding protein UgpB n=1 Tax=Methylobacterium sp. NEAU 140 TaxID=3064945 RepID=UPI002735BF95|nr:sn-glycerol-3-phosphate ABC transporter substrate-binding protein UgpB [Methylobacterium sp. NEAU 140]MDP4022096.1 sn-glycerol-3-phosphate ABC transporter substrate-binding protein UgpB [Methylobacterium sp. NEAU 140]
MRGAMHRGGGRPRPRLWGLLLLALAAALRPGPAAAVTEIQFWHALDGPNGALVARIAEAFNATQEAYRVVPVYKGSYAETISGGIAAYRTGAAPHLLQVFEVGNGTMAAAVGAVRPVAAVMREAGLSVAPGDFLPVVATNYLDADGEMLSLPFNVSSTVMWINRDRLRQAGLDPARPPATWPEVFAAARRMREQDGTRCALAAAWPTWVHIEQLSAWHDRPLATRSNGLDGYDAELVFNGPLQVRHLQNLVDLHRAGAFRYANRTNGGELWFVSGECGLFLTSSSLYGKVSTEARFDWAVAPMPFYPDVVDEPQNAILGGGSLYVMQGKTPDEYRGVAQFLAFVLDGRQQALMYRNTGYIPTTHAAYAEARAAGLYDQNPQLQVAVNALTRRPPTRNSAGLRLGNMLQIRDLWAEEIEAALGGAKPPQRALDDAVSRGNQVLRVFQQRLGK